MIRSLHSALVISALLVCAPLAQAQTPAEELRQIEKALAAEKKDNESYRTAQRKAEHIIAELQKKLITQTAILQKTEKELLIVQDKNAATQESITNMEKALESQNKNLANLLIAAQRLHRVPPEAMLLRPGRPIDAARANLLLQRATPDIATQVSAIRDDLAALAELRQELSNQQTQLATLRANQRKQQNTLNQDIKQRQTLVTATRQKAEDSQEQIARMNQKASDLRKMLDELANRKTTPLISTPRPIPSNGSKRDTSITSAEKSHWGQSIMSFFKRGQGPSKMPLMGTIRTAYGEKLANGANSQGISISGTPQGMVIAPEKGVVRFAGPFRQYRLLVILEHDNGYHSLLGGLGEIYTKVGNSVAAGEPIGKLNKDAAHANLYYEVRQHGKPIDPRRAVRG
jgi:septal ring factor EnvC (AmiA/AmiB activator)